MIDGAALRARRVAADATLDAVAQRLGVTISHLSLVERGLRHPSPGLVERWAVELDAIDAERCAALALTTRQDQAAFRAGKLLLEAVAVARAGVSDAP